MLVKGVSSWGSDDLILVALKVILLDWFSSLPRVEHTLCQREHRFVSLFVFRDESRWKSRGSFQLFPFKLRLELITPDL